MSSPFPIGVFDSGAGGLTVLREITVLLPREQTLYVGDTARCPYGGRPAAEVSAFCDETTRFLLARGCKLIVVACNTATAGAIDALRAAHPNVPFVGMEPAVKPAALRTRTGVVGVLATAGTLGGGHFRRTKALHAAATRVVEIEGAGLVELVERGGADTPAADALLRRLLAPALNAGADALVLGCTHFSFLKNAIRRVAGDALELFDGNAATARRVHQLLGERGLLAVAEPAPETPPAAVTPALPRFFATGRRDVMERMAAALFGGGARVEAAEFARNRSERPFYASPAS